MHARYHVERFSPWLAPELASGLLDGFALAGGLTLLALATRSWGALQAEAAAPATAR